MHQHEAFILKKKVSPTQNKSFHLKNVKKKILKKNKFKEKYIQNSPFLQIKRTENEHCKKGYS